MAISRIPAVVACGLLLLVPRLFAGPDANPPNDKFTTAEQAKSLFDTGVAYYQGTNGVPQDGKKAVAIFYELAVYDNPESQRCLGIAYAEGNGVEQNWNKALDFFEAAARNGSARAEVDLGKLLWTGDAVPRDLPRAFFWISHAAARGEPDAAGDLGIMYEEGLGVQSDLVTSLKWLEIAAHEGFAESKPRLDEVMALTDASQRSDAERQARAFKAVTNSIVSGGDPEVATCSLGSHFVIPVKLFGGTKYLIPDTGSSYTVLDSEYQKDLGALLVRATSGATNFVQMPLYTAPDMFIGEKRLVSLWTGVADFEKFRQILGKPFDGILGMPCLKNHVVTFDADQNVFSIGGEVPEAIKAKALALPLKPIPGELDLYGIECVVDGKPIMFEIDTGDDDSVTLNEADWQRVFGQRSDISLTDYSVGIDGKIKSSAIARIKQLRVGTNVYDGLIANKDILRASPSRLGQGFLRRHLFVLDFPHETLYLLPGKRFKDPDEWNMSGLSLWWKDGQLVVYAVADKSPAFKGGLKPNDQIISINKQPANLLDLENLREQLKSEPGQNVQVEVIRGGETNLFQFQLKRMM